MILATRGRFTARSGGDGIPRPSLPGELRLCHPTGRDRRGSLYEKLLARGFLVRHWKTPPVSDGLRISIGTDGDMDSLARAIEEESRGRQ